MTSSRPIIHVGVVGLGLAASMVAPLLQQMPDAALVAGADSDERARETFSRRFGVETYSSLEQLCRSPDVDTVWVATPTTLHCEHSLLAMEHGKHVIVEKPMAISLAEADQMIERAQKHGVKLLCGGSRSANPIVRRMRQVVISEELGELQAMTAWASTDWMLRPRRPDELDTTRGGGVVYRQAPHQVDTVRFLAGGKAKSVRAVAGQWMSGRATAPGQYSAILSFEGGPSATLVYSGYGYFSSLELFEPGNAGPGSPGLESRLLARRQIQAGIRDEASAKLARVQDAPPVAAARGQSTFLSDLGLLVASFERGEIRQSPKGIYVYTDDGVREELIDATGLHSPEVAELWSALFEHAPLLHDGRWGLATLEVCLAMMTSAREQREVALVQQVAVPDGH